MKRLFLLSLTTFIFSSYCFSQSFEDGTNLVFVGFGIPPGQRIANDLQSYTKDNTKNFYDYKLKNYGTVVAKFEHGLHKNFGLGLNLEYSAATASFQYSSVTSSSSVYEQKIKSKEIGMFVKMNGHLPLTDKFDVYGGVGLGYFYTINNNYDSNPSNKSNVDHKESIFDFDYQITVGARLMIKENIGIFLEVGRASTPAQVGVAFKF